MLSEPGMLMSSDWIFFWKISLAELVPKLRRLYRHKPWCVANVVIYRLSGAKVSWWYPALRSNFEKTVAPLKVWVRSSIVGIGCCSRTIARFATRMSTEMRTSPSFLGVTTSGDTHGVGPLTFSIIPCCSRLLSFFSTFFLMWKDIRLAFWTTGSTVVSICSCTWSPVNWPIPVNKLGNLCSKLSTEREPSFTWLTCSLRIPNANAVL